MYRFFFPFFWFFITFLRINPHFSFESSALGYHNGLRLDLSVREGGLNVVRVYTDLGKIRVGCISNSGKIRIGCISVLRV